MSPPAAPDAVLLWHWRCLCIDFACRPFARLTTLAHGDRARRRRVVELAQRLAGRPFVPAAAGGRLPIAQKVGR